jgi:hypothetical protein
MKREGVRPTLGSGEGSRVHKRWIEVLENCSGEAGVLGKSMAGLCTCGWPISPTHLNWESRQSTPSV